MKNKSNFQECFLIGDLGVGGSGDCFLGRNLGETLAPSPMGPIRGQGPQVFVFRASGTDVLSACA